MRFLGLLVCLTGVVIYYPAWRQWVDVILSMQPFNQHVFANNQQIFANLANLARPVFEQAGLGAVLFWVGALMMLAFRR